MNLTKIIEELESIARQSDDAAASCEAIAKLHRPEFEECVHGETSQKNNNRALELYAHVITNEHEANRLRKEAVLFRAAIDELQKFRRVANSDNIKS